mmetsp:Transcript_63414/g.163165  ORF Transcript_63414/g.163165 Transcript_63414/m.163165 type:complete len:1066 (-) Transcript_63414:10-3207(-)
MGPQRPPTVEELLTAISATYKKEVGELHAEVARLRELLALSPKSAHGASKSEELPPTVSIIDTDTGALAVRDAVQSLSDFLKSQPEKQHNRAEVDHVRKTSFVSEVSSMDEEQPCYVKSLSETSALSVNSKDVEAVESPPTLPAVVVSPPVPSPVPISVPLPGEAPEPEKLVDTRRLSVTMGRGTPQPRLARTSGSAPVTYGSDKAAMGRSSSARRSLRKANTSSSGFHGITPSDSGNTAGLHKTRPRSLSFDVSHLDAASRSSLSDAAAANSRQHNRKYSLPRMARKVNEETTEEDKEDEDDDDSDVSCDAKETASDVGSSQREGSPVAVVNPGWKENSRAASLQFPATSPRIQNRRPSNVSVLSAADSVASYSSSRRVPFQSRAATVTSNGRRPSVISINAEGMAEAASQRGSLDLHSHWLDVASAAYMDPGWFAPTAKSMALLNSATVGSSKTRNSGHSRMHRGKSIVGLHAQSVGKRIGTCMQRFVAQPSSPKRILWDILGVVALNWDLIMIPLRVFRPSSSKGIQVIGVLTTCYWTLDIFACFLLGFHAKGIVELRPLAIAKRYLRSWFVPDVTIASLDWFFMVSLAGADTGAPEGIRSVFRSLRAIRLIRLIKMQALISDFTVILKIKSEFARTMMGIFKLVLCILVLNHFIACGFYGLHDVMAPQPGRSTWVVKNFNDDHGFDYRYWTSFHWSMTQFTPASMEVVPVNAVERFYTVCVLLLAMITFSSFISSISGAMTRLTLNKSIQREQSSKLFRYLGERRVSTEIVTRIWHYLRAKDSDEVTRLSEKDVVLLDTLPESLKVDMRTEMFQPVLSLHPFFQKYAELEPNLLRQIAKSALKEQNLRANEELFGDTAPVHQMFFVTDGVLHYTYPLENDEAGDRVKAEVQKGQWACEAALWASALDLYGPFVAEVTSGLILLDSNEFKLIVPRFPASQGYAAEYAEGFMEFVKEKAEDCRWKGCLANDSAEIAPIASRCMDDHVEMAFEASAGFANSCGEAESYDSPRVDMASMPAETYRMWLFSRGRSQSNLDEHGNATRERAAARKGSGDRSAKIVPV